MFLLVPKNRSGTKLILWVCRGRTLGYKDPPGLPSKSCDTLFSQSFHWFHCRKPHDVVRLRFLYSVQSHGQVPHCCWLPCSIGKDKIRDERRKRLKHDTTGPVNSLPSVNHIAHLGKYACMRMAARNAFHCFVLERCHPGRAMLFLFIRI